MVGVELVDSHAAEGREQGAQGGAGLVDGAEVLVVTVAWAVVCEQGASRC